MATVVWNRAPDPMGIFAALISRNQFAPDSLLEGDCVDALRGSRAFLASDCHAGCRFVSGLFARPMTAGLDGLSACRGSHLDFALDAHSLAAGLPG
jgi:hypothetical protein